jgi:hypothetical protein
VSVTDGAAPAVAQGVADGSTIGTTDAKTATLRPAADVTVRLIKHPRPDVDYPATVLSDDGDHVVLRAPWSGDEPRDFGFVRFEQGDVWTEHFWRTRWFSIKEVAAADGSIKGWYCDVARPATVEPGLVVLGDLDLDLWLSGDRATTLRLDEDEFLESGLTAREPETAAAAVRALDELEALAGNGFEDLLVW